MKDYKLQNRENAMQLEALELTIKSEAEAILTDSIYKHVCFSNSLEFNKLSTMAKEAYHRKVNDELLKLEILK